MFNWRPLMRGSMLTALLCLTAALSTSPTAALFRPVTDHVVGVVTSTLENRFQRDRAEYRKVAGIIVLGGGAERALEALVLARQYPDIPIILSGPGADEELVLTSAPELADRLIIDRRPRNTFENALFSRQLANPKPRERWLVVTSAIHMPRSMGAFRVAGFAVEPWPVSSRPQRSEQAAAMLQHEVLGLVYYRLRGRTEVLLPGMPS